MSAAQAGREAGGGPTAGAQRAGGGGGSERERGWPSWHHRNLETLEAHAELADGPKAPSAASTVMHAPPTFTPSDADTRNDIVYYVVVNWKCYVSDV